MTEAAARGATAPLTAALIDLSKKLGVTEDATRTLLRIVGEQGVPLKRLSQTLAQVANDYRRLLSQVAALDAVLSQDNPVARSSVAQGKVKIETGAFAEAKACWKRLWQRTKRLWKSGRGRGYDLSGRRAR